MNGVQSEAVLVLVPSTISPSGVMCVQPWMSVVIGVASGAVYNLFKLATEWLKVDDPVDATAVHAGCGIWGLVAAGALFDKTLLEEVYPGAAPTSLDTSSSESLQKVWHKCTK